jgi:hypothetical protein
VPAMAPAAGLSAVFVDHIVPAALGAEQ